MHHPGDPAARPLVALTRSAEDNASLGVQLEAWGLGWLDLPCIATEACRPPEARLAALRGEGPFAAVAFPSKRAVAALLDAPDLAASLGLAPGARLLVAAVGPATAEALRSRGWPVHLQPEEKTGAALAEALAARLGPGARVLLPGGDRARAELPEGLAARGLAPVPLEVYAHGPAPAPKAPARPDAVICASPSAAETFLEANPDLVDAPFVAIGPTTEAALARLGARRILRAAGPSAEALVEATLAALGLASPGGLEAPTRAHPDPDAHPHGRETMTANRTLSDKLFQRATALMPGGVNSPVRAFGAVGGHPVYFRKGRGAELIDVDGNAYVDFCMSWGPLILGHWPEAIREEVAAAMGEGLTFGACSPREVACAEAMLLGRPAGDLVRFVSSGTEAVMSALRLARGVTGRPKILKFEGCYHGHSDGLLVKAGSGLATSGVATSKGVPPGIANETVVAPLDDEEALEAAFAEYGDALAAAVIEPLPANAGLLEQRPELLQRLRELCTRHGALFIADEVISGYRLTYGSWAEALGLCPDLTTYGKIIGGGMPVGALSGRAELMTQLAPLGPVYQAGTLSGNPVAMAAGAATLKALEDGSVYARLEDLGQAFDAALGEANAAAGLPWLRWHRVGSIVWLHLDEGPLPRRSDRVSAAAIERFNRIHPAMLERGFYLPPSGWEVFFLSAAHSEDHVAGLARALVECLKAS